MEPYEETTPPVDTQDAYRRIRSWIGRPRATRAYSETEMSCVYADNGNRCAIGGILPEDLLDLVRDSGDNVSGIISEFEQIRLFFANCNRTFLTEAQRAHDRNTPGKPEEYLPAFATDQEWQQAALERLDEAARNTGLQVLS